MAGSLLALDLAAGAATVPAVAFACLWLRPRVGKHRPCALVLAAPGLVLAVAAVGLALAGSAQVTVPLWCAAAWAFWPVRDHHWQRFETAFWSHVARHQELHVADRDAA
jgi:uncharacterized membrane protein